MLQNKVSKLISLRFAESSDPMATEALGILLGVSGSYNEIWEARTELVAMWYKCWLESQVINYEKVAGE